MVSMVVCMSSSCVSVETPGVVRGEDRLGS